MTENLEKVSSQSEGSGDTASAFEVEDERPPKVAVFSTRTALWTAFALSVPELAQVNHRP